MRTCCAQRVLSRVAVPYTAMLHLQERVDRGEGVPLLPPKPLQLQVAAPSEVGLGLQLRRRVKQRRATLQRQR